MHQFLACGHYPLIQIAGGAVMHNRLVRLARCPQYVGKVVMRGRAIRIARQRALQHFHALLPVVLLKQNDAQVGCNNRVARVSGQRLTQQAFRASQLSLFA